MYLAGGIGITPFLSMLRDAEQGPAQQQTALFYSNRSPDDAAMLAELRALDTARPDFALIAAMTDLLASAGVQEANIRG